MASWLNLHIYLILVKSPTPFPYVPVPNPIIPSLSLHFPYLCSMARPTPSLKALKTFPLISITL